MSVKTAARDRRYARDRAAFLAEHPVCEVAWDARCSVTANEVHHMAGRYPSVFFRQDLWRATCRSCHHEVTVHPREAIARGVSVHRHGVGA